MWQTQLITGYSGTGSISLRDLLEAPEQAFDQIQMNLKNNWAELLVASTVFGFTSKFARRALRGPINKVNRMVFTGKNAPLRGMGIRV
jgi:hypothetical protein